jgi:hypothetical protein
LLRGLFPPQPDATAQTEERNAGRYERRRLRVREVTAETVGFPFAAQVGELCRWRAEDQAEPERVYLITSAPASELSPQALLAHKRNYWSIENGLHQRLDGAGREDTSRVRLRNNAWVLALFRRWALSVANAWIAREKNLRWATTQGFYDAMRRNRCRDALATLFRKSARYDSS